MLNSKYKSYIFGILIGSLCLLSSLCFAGGGEYESADDTADAGPAYFGFVREDRGQNIAGAKVLLITKTGVKVELKSNILGIYRSHIAKNVKPDEVTLSCQKEGYAQVKIVVRGNTNNRYIESDCIMRKVN